MPKDYEPGVNPIDICLGFTQNAWVAFLKDFVNENKSLEDLDFICLNWLNLHSSPERTARTMVPSVNAASTDVFTFRRSLIGVCSLLIWMLRSASDLDDMLACFYFSVDTGLGYIYQDMIVWFLNQK